MMYDDALTRSAVVLSMTVYTTILSSCTTISTEAESSLQLRKTRIVERNLLGSNAPASSQYRRAGHDVSAVPLLSAKPHIVAMVEDRVIVKDFIVFQNESTILAATDADRALSLVEPLAEDSLILIVGNSHGTSAVGTGKLAQKRADAVYHYFSKHGISKRRMRRIASWGNVKVAHAPSRGVQVMVVKNRDPSNLLLSLAKS